MFDKLKQLAQLKGLQDKIKKERVEVEKNGVRLTMDGTFEVIEIKLNPDLDLKTQEESVKYCLREARGKIQTTLAKNFAGSLM